MRQMSLSSTPPDRLLQTATPLSVVVPVSQSPLAVIQSHQREWITAIVVVPGGPATWNQRPFPRGLSSSLLRDPAAVHSKRPVRGIEVLSLY